MRYFRVVEERKVYEEKQLLKEFCGRKKRK